ncbi:MAG: hypothetical protein R3D29_05510 [Nitratireductor sp.]
MTGKTVGMDISKARAALEAARTAIERESQLAAEARSTVELDQQSVGRLSRMDAMQDMLRPWRAQERKRQNDLVASTWHYAGWMRAIMAIAPNAARKLRSAAWKSTPWRNAAFPAHDCAYSARSFTSSVPLSAL